VRLSHIRLVDFRNVEIADIPLDGGRHFFCGANGQGKTNILEAAGLISALRSFRTTEIQPLIRQGQAVASVKATVSLAQISQSRIDIHLNRSGRKVLVDEAPIERFSDFIGRYPTVAISSADIQLLRGPPSQRRRFFDLILSFGDPEYLNALKGYHKTLQERNALIKNNGTDGEIDAFDHLLSPFAATLVHQRKNALLQFQVVFRDFYQRIAESKTEIPELRYKPSEPSESPEEFAAVLQQNRERDKVYRTTQSGPHRDDFTFLLNGSKAVDFASEGQQRALVLSLRFVQFEYFREKSNTIPVILADDILGELDPLRRQRFWEACDPNAQILATGTELPEASEAWDVFQVLHGSVEVAL
jgi:DNA replication and repair protein RecF